MQKIYVIVCVCVLIDTIYIYIYTRIACVYTYIDSMHNSALNAKDKTKKK